MKIACINDLHLNIMVYTKVYDKEYIGLPFRHGDFMRAFKWMVEKTIEEGVDLVVIGGDVYDYYEPTNDIRGFFSQQLEKLVANKIPVIILVGNHDICKKHHALKDIHELNLKKIKVIEEPKIIKFKDHQLVLLPYSLDIERKVRTIKQEFVKLAEEFKAKDDGSDSIFFGHFGIKGAVLSDYNLKKTRAKVKKGFLNDNAEDVSISDLDMLNVSHVIMGDYHKHQLLDTKNCFSMYTGSIEKTDFSEINQEKGFVIYDSNNEDNGGYGKCRFIEYPNCRPMLQLEGTLTDMKKQFSKVKYEELKGAIVKFAFKGNREEATQFSLGQKEFNKDIKEKIDPIHFINESKVSSPKVESEVKDLKEEVLQIEDKEEGDSILPLLEEMIDEVEEIEEERVILKDLMSDMYNRHRRTS
jgi:DNA repair exonuclease SbcCD nuclease subunit